MIKILSLSVLFFLIGTLSSEEMKLPKAGLEFEKYIEKFESSGELAKELHKPKKIQKTPSQVSGADSVIFPVMVEDSILWDTSQVFLADTLTSGSVMQGRVAVDDSGFVHVAYRKGSYLRYRRSTDFGATFEQEIILEDSIGSILEIYATGNHVYIYCRESNGRYLVRSSDKGNTWNVTKEPTNGRPTFVATNDSAFEYYELPGWGSGGGIHQRESFDGGVSFSPFVNIVDSIANSGDKPTPAIGGNTIVYTRKGSAFATDGSYAYRSFDLGNTWQQPIQLEPYNNDAPRIDSDGFDFHFVHKVNHTDYVRSLDNGQTFPNTFAICLISANCFSSLSTESQVSARNGTVFVIWRNWLDLLPTQPQQEVIRMRFSRDKGTTWSPYIIGSEFKNNFLAVGPFMSVASDDSLVYIGYVHTDGISISPQGILNLRFRRGFYKYPLFSSNDFLNFGVVDTSSIVSSNLQVTNEGVIPLEITQMELPAGVYFGDSSTPPDSIFPITILPDSTKNLQFSFKSNLVGVFSDTLKIFHNQQIDPVKNIIVNAEVVTDLEDYKNNLRTFALSQNYPNPFNPTTLINYELGITNYEKSKLVIFNVLGQKVREFELKEQVGSVIWDGTDSLGKQVSSGVYLYRLESGKSQKVKKMILLR